MKKINVKGIEIKGTTGTNSYIYLEGIDISKNKNPRARIEIEVKLKDKIVKKIFKLNEGEDLFIKSNEMPQYKGYKISKISGIETSVSFTNGQIIYAGDINGEINEEHIRRIQIRETIKSHLNKEKLFFKHGIKIISLFFIDKVDRYRQYEEDGTAKNGDYARIFEEEYENIVNSLENEDLNYINYLKNINTKSTHEGYFSIDKKTNRLIDPKETGRANNKVCNDVDAFDLIMKNKERLLNLKEPVRFIFSHSALKEGWDNPNVFQICILRNNDSTLVKKRQEIGRGLRLCVNQEGVRVDEDYDFLDSNKVNILTIVANESYEKFAGALQSEFEENLRERPTKLTIDYLCKNKISGDKITESLANKIYIDFIKYDYVDDNYSITQKFKDAVEKGEVNIRDELKEKLPEIIDIVKKLYEVSDKIEIGNETYPDIKNKLNSNFEHKEFKKLWNYINTKSTYKVNFNSEKLIENSISKINKELNVIQIFAEIKTGVSKDKLEQTDITNKNLFSEEEFTTENLDNVINENIKYDLIGKLVTETNLTRNTIIKILSEIEEDKFEEYKKNPEDFMMKVTQIINEVKAEIIYENLEYYKTEEKIPISIFEEDLGSSNLYPELMKKYIYDYLESDSKTEIQFGKSIDSFDKVLVFSKIPRKKYDIKTPVGSFSPDWLIVFDKDKVQYAYFVVETKGSNSKMELRKIEDIKIECAKKHFKAISTEEIKFDVVNSFETLRNNFKL